MQYSLDLHLHADHNPATGKWHGERPDKLAAAIIAGDLDAAVIVEHDRISERPAQVRAEVERIRDRLARETGHIRKEVYVGLGVEMSLRFEGDLYHVGYAFEEDLDANHLPAIPEQGADVEELTRLQAEHPGVATLFHPCWQDDRRGTSDKTLELAASGYFDALEIINGKALRFLEHDSQFETARKRKTRVMDVTESNLNTFLKARQRLKKGDRLAPVGCSDAHLNSTDTVGLVYTEFSGASPRDFFKAIRRGQTFCASKANGSIRKNLKGLLGRGGAGKFMRIS